MNGVPPWGLPKMRTSVGRSILPIFAAPAAWSMRAKTFSPRCLALSSNRFMVSLAAKGLLIAMKPSAPKAADENASSDANTKGSGRFMGWLLDSLRSRLASRRIILGNDEVERRQDFPEMRSGKGHRLHRR